MHPQNADLNKFTLLVKHIIYDDARMKAFLHMLGSPEGAIIAVHTILGAIQQAKPIPPGIVHQLAFNTYTLLVDMAQKITGKKATPELMKVIIEGLHHATTASLVSPPSVKQANTAAGPPLSWRRGNTSYP